MKSSDFKRKDSTFKSIKDIDIKKKKKVLNWDRITYFFLLVIFLFFLGNFLFQKIYYVKADGQVLFNSIDIQNIDDCRINNFYVNEGDYVCEGDTLFTFYNDDECLNASSNITTSSNSNDGWLIKEISNIEKNIALNNNEINSLINQKKTLTEKLIEIKQQVILDALPKSQYLNLKNEIVKLEGKINLLTGENSILNNSLTKIKSANYESNSKNKSSINIINNVIKNGLKVFITPMEGTVTRVFKQNKEVAIKSEIIMKIHMNENLFIKAFFDQEDLDELNENDIVEIKFPDDSRSYGKINRFYFATYKLPEEFQKKYEPTTRSIAVDIYPLDKNETVKWKQYYKMSVIIRKKRF